MPGIMKAKFYIARVNCIDLMNIHFDNHSNDYQNTAA